MKQAWSSTLLRFDLSIESPMPPPPRGLRPHAKSLVRAFCLAVCSVLYLGASVLGQSKTATVESSPSDRQFITRDPVTELARFDFLGVLHDESVERLVLTARTGDVVARSTEVAASTLPEVVGKSPDKSFSVSLDLPASMTPYDVELTGITPNGEIVVHKVSQVTVGDAYIVYGQSNAEARQYNGSANANRDNNILTFGNASTVPANMQNDLTWYVADGDDAARKGFIGQWPIKMARLLLDAYGVPISIINGAVGGQPILYFQRNDGNRTDLNTAYGRMLYRAQQAGVAGTARAIFWYQGETDGSSDSNTPPAIYESRFAALYNDLRQDYPGVEKIYVYQVRDGCGLPSVQLRDRQRQFEDKFADVQVVSTTGLNGHDGCHFSYQRGYEDIGQTTFRLVARDFYGSQDVQGIDPPFIRQASFTNILHSEITLRFKDPDDAMLWEAGSEFYFRLEGSPVTVTGGRASGPTVVMQLSGDGSNATGISYLGHRLSGAWVANTRGVGMLTFYNIPIAQDLDDDGANDNVDNCPTIPNPDQADADSDGTGDACDDEADGDGLPNEQDNCPFVFNPGQEDFDLDGTGDVCDDDTDGDLVENDSDNCPATPNPDQLDTDSDGQGDLCDLDIDGDGIANTVDNCVSVANPGQEDDDQDGHGNACDLDLDGDGIDASDDNCPLVPNADQSDIDGDDIGDVCDADVDGDDVLNGSDNCPAVANPDQRNLDSDALGDACDPDVDGDNVDNEADNCPIVANPDQADDDGDGDGNACDDDADGDNVTDSADNCPMVANPDQSDLDDDGDGDACDPDADGDGLENGSDNCPLVVNPNQADDDDDGAGNACDPDSDGDSIDDDEDNCVAVSNPRQENLDGDEFGDACDPDIDGDNVLNGTDNCSVAANPNQADLDDDGLGDVCDADMDGDEVANDLDNCPATANSDQLDADLNGVGNACQEAPDRVGLFQSFPNPARTTATIQFSLPSTERVVLELFDVTGRLIETAASGTFGSGYHAIVIDVASLNGGIYVYVLTAGDARVTKTLTVIR